MASFQLTVNGREYHLDVPADTSLLEVLRNDIGDKSPKFGCGLGQCGACFVLIDGHPTPACDTPSTTSEARCAPSPASATPTHRTPCSPRSWSCRPASAATASPA